MKPSLLCSPLVSEALLSPCPSPPVLSVLSWIALGVPGLVLDLRRDLRSSCAMISASRSAPRWSWGSSWCSPSSSGHSPLRQSRSCSAFAGAWGRICGSLSSCGGVAIKGKSCVSAAPPHLCDVSLTTRSVLKRDWVAARRPFVSGGDWRALRLITCQRFDPRGYVLSRCCSWGLKVPRTHQPVSAQQAT